MPIEESEVLSYCLFDKNGNPIKLEEVKELPQIEQERYAAIAEEIDFSFTVKAAISHVSGLFDYITGINTPACRRYLRSLKRQKEKMRREKLKHG